MTSTNKPRPGQAGQQSHLARTLQENSPYATIGFQLAASIVFFVGGGYLLDSWLQTTPWLTLAGALLGIMSFFALIYKLLYNLREADARAKKQRSATGDSHAENAPDDQKGVSF